jgi:hypothetical protein
VSRPAAEAGAEQAVAEVPGTAHLAAVSDGNVPVPAVPAGHPDRPAVRSGREPVVRAWPLIVLALPAAVAVWSGWIGIGQLTGFGEVQLLRGIWNSLRLDTVITLPVGVEAYAAYALRAWLSASPFVSARTRRFARRSAIGSLALGMAGQVAWHLLAQEHVTRAPWFVTTGVSCLPVLVLGMAAALVHLLRADADAARQAPALGPDPETGPPDQTGCGLVSADRLEQARQIAVRLQAAGERVSRRTLRAAGLHGSNTELGTLAVMIGSQPGQQRTGYRQREARISPMTGSGT